MTPESKLEIKGQDSSLETHKPWPKVAIIVLNWNGLGVTIECLESLQRITYPNHRIIVVDNGSTDGSWGKLKEGISQYILIGNEENLGFAGGTNVGIRYALSEEFDYTLLLNNDTKVLNGDFLNVIVKYAEKNTKISVIGPTVYKNDSEKQYTILHFPTVLNAIYYGYLNMRKNKCVKPQEVESVSGCCFLVRSRAIEEVGLLDENFFLYAEEIEWCYRMRKAGWGITYLPIKSVLHYGAWSTKRESRQMRIYKRSNLIYMLVKHEFKVQAVLLASLVILNHLKKVIFSNLKIRNYGQEYDWAFIRELTKEIIKKWRLGRSEAS